MPTFLRVEILTPLEECKGGGGGGLCRGVTIIMFMMFIIIINGHTGLMQLLEPCHIIIADAPYRFREKGVTNTFQFRSGQVVVVVVGMMMLIAVSTGE